MNEGKKEYINIDINGETLKFYSYHREALSLNTKTSLAIEEFKKEVEYKGVYSTYFRLSDEDFYLLYEKGVNREILGKVETLFGPNVDVGHIIELLTLPGAKSLIEYLEKKPQKLLVGNKYIYLDIDDYVKYEGGGFGRGGKETRSLHLIRGILINLKKENINIDLDDFSWENQINKFQGYLNEFIQNKEEDKVKRVFFISASKEEDNNFEGRSYGNGGELKSQLGNLFGNQNILDYSTGSELCNSISSPDDFIEKIKEATSNFEPGEKALVYIGLHGRADGSSYFSKGRFTKKHYEELLKLSRSGKITLHLQGCYDGMKFNDGIENYADIRLSSNESVSVSQRDWFLEAFKQGKDGNYLGDFNGDGKVTYNEAQLYKILNYQYSYLPTIFFSKVNGFINIS